MTLHVALYVTAFWGIIKGVCWRNWIAHLTTVEEYLCNEVDIRRFQVRVLGRSCENTAPALSVFFEPAGDQSLTKRISVRQTVK